MWVRSPQSSWEGADKWEIPRETEHLDWVDRFSFPLCSPLSPRVTSEASTRNDAPLPFPSSFTFCLQQEDRNVRPDSDRTFPEPKLCVNSSTVFREDPTQPQSPLPLANTIHLKRGVRQNMASSNHQDIWWHPYTYTGSTEARDTLRSFTVMFAMTLSPMSLVCFKFYKEVCSPWMVFSPSICVHTFNHMPCCLHRKPVGSLPHVGHYRKFHCRYWN